MSDDPSESLISAVRSGDLKCAKALIHTFGLSHSEAWDNGYNLLFHALHCHHEAMARLLLERGSEVNSKKARPPSDTPLHLAVEKEYTEIVSMLLERKADVNAQSVNGMTALHLAIRRENLEIAKELLNHGACVNVQTQTRLLNDNYVLHYTALHYAALTNDPRLVKLLLRKGADINAVASEKKTPLHLAMRSDSEEVVKLLIKSGASVDAVDSIGVSILRAAVEYKTLKSIKLVLKYEPNVNSEANRISLHAAMRLIPEYYDDKIVKALLRYGFTVSPKDAKNVQFLYGAVNQNCIEIVEALLKFGANVNALPYNNRGESLLHIAVICGYSEMTALLLRNGANINAKDKMQKRPIDHAAEDNDVNITKQLWNGNFEGVRLTRELIHTAVKMGCCEIVENLLDRAPNLLNATSYGGKTLLHEAVLDGGSCEPSSTVEIVNLLISRGACVNAATENGTTALHMAAEGGHVKVVEGLLANKANIHARGECCATPLHSAAKSNNPEVVKVLLNNAGAIVNAKDNNGNTALHVASQVGSNDIVELLVEKNARLDAVDNDHSTPLHLAAINGQPRVVETLLTLDAPIDAKNILGKTALHLAVENDQSDVVRVLLDYGADVNATDHQSMTPLDDAIFYEDDDKMTPEILKKYILAIMAMNLYVSEENLTAIDLYHKRHDILEDCQTQVANMKKTKIGDSNVTFYDVLTGNINQLVGYARNETIVKDLEAEQLNDHFPTYSRMITRRIRQGLKRMNLLHSGLKSLSALSGYSLPDLSAIELSNYLSNKDLENLVKADLTPTTTIATAKPKLP